MTTPLPTTAIRMVGDDAWALAFLALAGFGALAALDHVARDPLALQGWLEQLRGIRDRVPFPRALLVLEALADAHPNRAEILAYGEEMRRVYGGSW